MCNGNSLKQHFYWLFYREIQQQLFVKTKAEFRLMTISYRVMWMKGNLLKANNGWSLQWTGRDVNIYYIPGSGLCTIYICYQKLQPAASQLTTGSVFLTPTNLFCTISASNKLSYIRQHNIGSAYYSPAIMDHIKLLESDAGGQSLIIKYDGNIWACTVNVT